MRQATLKQIQYRGPLPTGSAARLEAFLQKGGLPGSRGWEKVLFFDTSMFPLVGDFVTGFSRISLKKDSSGLVLRLKEGHPSDSLRLERSIRVRPEDLSHLFALLGALGLRHAFYRPAYRRQYAIGPARLSLKTHTAIGDHFELSLQDEADLDCAAVRKLFEEGGLWCWTRTEYTDRIQEGMRTFPARSLEELVRELQDEG